MIRINKFFTENGLCSRREADELVEQGRVTINGRVAKHGDRAEENDVVAVDGKALRIPRKHPVVLAYHKPPGIICTTDPNVPENIVDAVGYPERIFNIGRLDQFSEGLILLTNRGEIVNEILRSKYGHEKEYIVDVNEFISDRAILEMQRGMVILGKKTLPCGVERLGPKRVRIILTEGRNRQIRRMIEGVNLRVSRLRRVRIMHIELGSLPRGEWRRLTPKETQELDRQIKQSQQMVNEGYVDNFMNDDEE
ncbi:MAG: pseudouridine synthase [Bdellovibrionales bacterium]|nr:pseudouridine synthase [Bdellovibrionales bacterium]